jgi:hypothetical protein
MVKKKNIITQGSVCPKSAYNFASSLSSSSLLNHGGQLSFCFLLPTYEQLTGLYLCSNSLRASTESPIILLHTYLLDLSLQGGLTKVKPDVNSVGVHQQLNPKP